YVVGGYARGETSPVRDAFVLDGPRWRRLRAMPYARAAGGAAFIGNTLYVAGGVGPYGTARSMEGYDVARRRWRVVSGPSPREHLGVTALGGQLYVVAGRLHGRPLSIVQRWSPLTHRWQQLAPMPEPRGATAASVADGEIVDVGAESAGGTSAAVYAYNPASN